MSWNIGDRVVNKSGKIGTIVKFGADTGLPWILYDGYYKPMRAIFDHIRRYEY